MSMHQSCPQCKKESDGELPFCPWCRFPQKTLAGKYRLLSLLGEGGMGILYHAEHIGLSMDRDRAIKLIPETLYQQPSVAKRLRREIEVTSFLSKKCDHIVQVYDDFGEEEGMGFFYVMELLSGKSLRDFLRSQGVLSFPVALHILGQICEAIHLAHQHDILHRDLKPENIFLIERAEQPLFVKVIDFGITRFLHDANTQLTRGVVGTPVYMAPEQFGSTANGPRTDLYALALIFYEMLTGEVPFVQPDDNPVAIGMKRLTEDPPDLSSLYPALQIPLDVSRILTQCLRTHPHQRPESVAAFWATLAPFSAVSASLRLPSLSSGKYAHKGLPLSSGVPVAFDPKDIPQKPPQNATLTPQEPFAPASPRVPLWKNILFGGLALGLSLVLGIWGGAFLMKHLAPQKTRLTTHRQTSHTPSSITKADTPSLAKSDVPPSAANTDVPPSAAKSSDVPPSAAKADVPPSTAKSSDVPTHTQPKSRLVDATKTPAEVVAPSAELPAPWLQPTPVPEPVSPIAQRSAPETSPRNIQKRRPSSIQKRLPSRIRKRRSLRNFARTNGEHTLPKLSKVARVERHHPKARKVARVERHRPKARKVARVERTREEIVAELQRERDDEERRLRTTQQSGERGLPARFLLPIKPPVMKGWTEASAERGLYQHQPDDHAADVRKKLQIYRFLLVRHIIALQKGGYSDKHSFDSFLGGVERQWQRAKQYLPAKEAATFHDEYALSLLMKSRISDGLNYYKHYAIPIPDLYSASRHAERMHEMLVRWKEDTHKYNPRISALAPRWWSCALLDLLRAGILSVRLIRAYRPSLEDQRKWPDWPEMMVAVEKQQHALQQELVRLFQESKRWTQKHRLTKWRCAVLSKGLGK